MSEPADPLRAIVLKYIDRMNDVAPECGDPAERILADFVADVEPVLRKERTALSQSARPVASEGEKPVAYMYQMPGELEPRFQTWEGMSCNEEDAGMTETALYPQSALNAARAQERAEIVAWLRDEAADLAPHNEQHRVALDHAADAIATLQHKEADHGCQ